MTKAEVKQLVSPRFVRELFGEFVVDSSQPRWAITICGKIIAIGGKMFYDSRDQAVKGFYNAFNWRARRKLYIAQHPEDVTGWGWWRNEDSKTIWSGFKDAITEDYGFKIIQV